MALSLLSAPLFDKEAIRELTKDLLDGKHGRFVEDGLRLDDRQLVLHGVVGALSHYESEQEKQRNADRRAC